MSYKPPKGLVIPKVLRGMIRSIARELAKDDLSVKDELALLRQQSVWRSDYGNQMRRNK